MDNHEGIMPNNSHTLIVANRIGSGRQIISATKGYLFGGNLWGIGYATSSQETLGGLLPSLFYLACMYERQKS